LSISDPNLRTEVMQQYEKVTLAGSFGDDYKATLDSIKSAAKQIMGDSLEGSASYEASQLTGIMQRNFAKDYKEGLRKFNGDGTRALQYATDILQRDKDAAIINKDPTARYYSVNGPANQKIFKNVKASQAKTAKRQAEIEQTVRETIGTIGVRALDTPGFLGTEEELKNLSDANRFGQVLVFTPQIKQAAKQLGISPLEAANAGIAAFNKYSATKIEPLYPDPSLQQINKARPETIKLFVDNPTLERIRRGSAEVYPGALQDPGNMRGAYRSVSTSYSGSSGQRAFIQTVRSVEGTGGSDGYNKVYGGAVVPQLTKMTLRELYDAIKLGGTDRLPARLGGGRIPFKKDKYNSSASGALQLMPGTLLGLIQRGRYKWTDIFSPETQDQMIIDLAMEGGINPDKMDLNQMTKAGNIWAGLTPRYGQTQRTANQSLAIYNQFLNRN